MTTIEALRELMAAIPAEEVAAIGVSGMVPAMVLLNAAGQPLRPSIQQNDARSITEVMELRAAVNAEEFFTITGGIPNQQNIDPRWRWLRRHEPAVIALPYFLGEKTPIFDPAARGVFAGVMLHHSRAHLYRAVLEAVCYGFAHHITLLRSVGAPTLPGGQVIMASACRGKAAHPARMRR